MINQDPEITLFNDDIPNQLDLGKEIAIDTEAMGLNLHNDRLCLVQIAMNSGKCFLVKINANSPKLAKNLIKVLISPEVTKIFHFARFDVALLNKTFEINVTNIFCTKIASKLARTFTSKHGLKDLCKDLLNIDISKQEQTSDWGMKELTKAQLVYAATDVLYLHQIKEKLLNILVRENRTDLAYKCFDCLHTITSMDAAGIDPMELFSH